MGTCSECGSQIILKDGEKTCPSCETEEIYYCWNCETRVDVTQPECRCSFFICQECGKCGKDCTMHYTWSAVDKMLGEHPKKKDIIREIQHKVFEGVKGKRRLECHRKVPISYAMVNLRNIAAKLKGYRVKNEEDHIAFQQMFQEIEDTPIGHTWTVNQIKKEGTHGQEFREMSNLAVCTGLARREIEEDKENNKKWLQYRRCDKEPCQYTQWKKLAVKTCKSCDIDYEYEDTNCAMCDKELKERLSYKQFCTKPKAQFTPVKKEEGDGEEENNTGFNQRTVREVQQTETTDWQEVFKPFC